MALAATFAAAALVGFGRELWTQHKKARTVIPMVKDRDGTYVDKTVIQERRFFKACLWFVAFCVLAFYALMLSPH